MCVLAPALHAHLPSATISDLSIKNIDFAMNLYRKISSFHDKNIFFSPLSVSTSFAAVLMAADGDTYEEILNGLNLHQLERADEPELLPKLFQLLNENITQNGSLKVHQAMAIFMQAEFQVEETFNDQMKEFFNADIKNVDFSDAERTVDFINGYIKQKTHENITEVISTLDPMMQLMLINTIFFQGESNHCCVIWIYVGPVVCVSTFDLQWPQLIKELFSLQEPGRCPLILGSLEMHPSTLTAIPRCKCQ